MLPVVTPAQMAAIDAEAPEPVTELIERAGRAVAREALDMLGGGYGARVGIYAGPGNNGADGIAAVPHLERRGARCEVVTPDGELRHAPNLIIDGCVGTGLTRDFAAPPVGDAPVLAIDIPSGIDGLTGRVRGSAVAAVRTVTFAAHKPGLLLGAGRRLSGEVVIADIGLDVGSPAATLITDDDLEAWPRRPTDAHKWQSAVWVIGGQPGMSGAPSLAAEAAARAGAGYVAVSTPGGRVAAHREAVEIDLTAAGWGVDVAARGGRFSALVIGPGLDPRGDSGDLASALEMGVPTVVDAGAIDVVSRSPRLVHGKPVVLTPHDGEFERLVGAAPGADRIDVVRQAAASLGAVLLVKGPTTVIAGPDGRVRLVTSGDQRLATAGTGDVLSGILGAALATGLDPLDAAALAAHVHGRAGASTGRAVIVASDLLDHVGPFNP